MSFGAPSLLLGLLAVPLAAASYVAFERRRSRRAAAWSSEAMQPNVVQRPFRRFGYAPRILLLLGLTALLVGFARPQEVRGIGAPQPPTIVLAFDTSGSMAAVDVRPTRLRAARTLALGFLRQLPARYRVAVVTFAGSVHLAVAPTLDRRSVLAGIPTSVTPRGGTALGDGIEYAVGLIAGTTRESTPGAIARPGAVLLFSDGTQTSAGATPQQAAVSAVVDYVPVDTVAVGTARGSVTQPVVVDGVHAANTIAVPAHPSTLRTISKETSGLFFAASALRSAAPLAGVYRSLHTFSTSTRKTRNLSPLTAAAALVLLLGGLGLSGLWFGRVA